MEERLKNAAVSILFHLSLGATQVCILVYSPRSGITGSTSLLLTLDIEHSAIGGGGGTEGEGGGGSAHPPLKAPSPKPTQPVGVCDEKMAQDYVEALRASSTARPPPPTPAMASLA